jgi:hypothetical protein
MLDCRENRHGKPRMFIFSARGFEQTREEKGVNMKRNCLSAGVFGIVAVSGEQTYAQAASYYVCADGSDDANDGRSEKTPFKTLQKAVYMAAAGTVKKITVIGSVPGDTTIENAGSTEILITGVPDAKVIILGGFCINNSKVRFTHTQITNTGKQGLYIDGKSVVTFGAGTLITGCHSTLGAVYAKGGTLNMMGNAAISGNKARFGGGVYVKDGTLNMTDNAAISGNTAKFCGGVCVMRGGTLNIMDNATISGNTAHTGGGAGFREGALNMSGRAAIFNNAATSMGGGVALFGSSALNMTGSTAVAGNKARNYGGGVASNSGMCILAGGKITGNAAKSGGGVWSGSGIDIENVEVSGNRAAYGAGVYIDKGKLTVSGGKITVNEAKFAGGGVYVNSGAEYETQNASVTDNKAREGVPNVFRN